MLKKGVMDSIGLRLKHYIEEKDLSAIEFSEQVGIQRSSLSHLYSGRNKPSIDLLLKIKKQFPDINLEWLITGEKSHNDLEIDNNSSPDSSKALKKDVTYVNNPNVLTDNQLINLIDNKSGSQSSKNRESIKVLVFYNDGSYEEFKKSEI